MATVLRKGRLHVVPASQLVPGDIVEVAGQVTCPATVKPSPPNPAAPLGAPTPQNPHFQTPSVQSQHAIHAQLVVFVISVDHNHENRTQPCLLTAALGVSCQGCIVICCDYQGVGQL